MVLGTVTSTKESKCHTSNLHKLRNSLKFNQSLAPSICQVLWKRLLCTVACLFVTIYVHNNQYPGTSLNFTDKEMKTLSV
jgi:hypothetical protein